MEKEDFKNNKIFAYHENKKSKFIIYSILIAIITILFITFYFTKLRHSNFFLIRIINVLIKHVSLNIFNLTPLGAFYTTTFGGLFFVPIPIELTFLAFLASGEINPFVVIALFLVGMVISFTIDYWVGERLSELSKKLIGYKKFYNMKVKLNEYGSFAVFAFNALPLPAQPFVALLGVFKYNKIKFYSMSILGQGIKLTLVTLGYLYIF